MNVSNSGPVNPRLLMGATTILLAGFFLLARLGALHIQGVIHYLLFLNPMTN